jgi:PEGA domain
MCVAAMALFLAGCGVQRELVFTSNPTNALVYLNGEELGRTPVQKEFLWYGKYDVIVRKEGYVTAKTTTWVKPPWWQWIPFDFVAELLPVHLRDKQIFTYSLLPAPTQPADSELMLENAAEYRAKLEGTGTTQPAVKTKKKKTTAAKATTKPHAKRRRKRAATTQAATTQTS